MTTKTVETGDGLELRVDDVGPRDARPVVFVHGLAQDRTAFGPIVASLAAELRCVVFDVRGHGDSSVPEGAEPYTDSARFANDVDAVVRGLELRAPILVPWSYGGAVVGDYLRHRGGASVGGILLVAAAIRIGRSAGAFFGSAMMDNARGLVSNDPAVYEASARAFVDGCSRAPNQSYAAERLSAMQRVPAQVRRALLSRDEDYVAAYTNGDFPLGAIQGDDDRVVLPSLAAHLREQAPRTVLTRLPGVGHLPFLEAPEAFERALRGVVAAARA